MSNRTPKKHPPRVLHRITIEITDEQSEPYNFLWDGREEVEPGDVLSLIRHLMRANRHVADMLRLMAEEAEQ